MFLAVVAEQSTQAPAPAAESPDVAGPVEAAAVSSDTVPAPAPEASASLTEEQRADINSVIRESTNQIWFEENVGQFEEGVKYGFKTRFGAMLVYSDHLRIVANQTDPETGEVGLQVMDVTLDSCM